MKNFIKNISVSVITIVIFFGGLEIAQRVRYYLKSENKYYLMYGIPLGQDAASSSEAISRAAPGPDAPETIDTYAEIPFARFSGYAKCVPGDYTREYRGEKFNVHINKEGFRGKELGPPGSDDIFRVVFLGGSSTQGLESPDDATIPAVLEDMLNKDRDFLAMLGKSKAEVVNAGMIGHTSFEINNLLNKEILKLEPDLLVLYSAFNDCRHTGVFEAMGIFEDNIVKRVMKKSWAWFYNHSLLFATLYEKFTLFKKKSIQVSRADEVAFIPYRENVNAMIDSASRNGIEFAILKQPLFIKGLPALQDKAFFGSIKGRIKEGDELTYEEAYYWMQSRQLDALDSISSDKGVMIIDPLPEVEKRDKEELFHDIVHLKKKGNALLAGVTYEYLKENYRPE